jgi:hypothetical protein
MAMAGKTTAVLPKLAPRVAAAPTQVATQTPDFKAFTWNQPFPFSRWVHVVFELDYDARAVRLRIDGRDGVVAQFPSTLSLGSDFFTRVRVGLMAFNPPSPAATFHVDNVAIRRR